MRVRQPVPEDAPDLGRIHVRAWQEGYKNGLMPDKFLSGLLVEDRVTMWGEALAQPLRPNTARFVSEDAAGVTGFIVVGPEEGQAEAPLGEVYSLNVDPEHWGQGHGAALLAAGAEALTLAGFPEAILWVHTGAERSRRFYQYNGWQPDGAERSVEVLGVMAPETRYRRALSSGNESATALL